MTNEPEMTLEDANEILDKDYGNAFDVAESKAFLAGHAAISKERDVYSEALEKIAGCACAIQGQGGTCGVCIVCIVRSALDKGNTK
jgi:hypothetical protein